MRDFRRGKDKTKIIECCSEEISISKRSDVMLCKCFLSAWLDFIRIWLAAVPNSTAVLVCSGFWPYQLIFHYWMLWQAFQTDTRKERFLTWVSLSLSYLFFISTLLSPLCIKVQLGMYKICKECVPEKAIFCSEDEMKLSVGSPNEKNFHPFLPIETKVFKSPSLPMEKKKLL